MKKSKSIIVILVALIVVMLGVGALGYFTQGFKDWSRFSLKDTVIVTDSDAGKAMAMPANLCLATPAAASVENGGVKLTARVEPLDAQDKEVDWSVNWVDPTHAWAVGKTATDYITITPESDGSNTATLAMVNAFGAQIAVTVSARSNPNISATCTVDKLQEGSWSEYSSFNYKVQHSIPGNPSFPNTGTSIPLVKLTGRAVRQIGAAGVSNGYPQVTVDIDSEIGYGTIISRSAYVDITPAFNDKPYTIPLSVSNLKLKYRVSTGGNAIGWDWAPFAPHAAQYGFDVTGYVSGSTSVAPPWGIVSAPNWKDIRTGVFSEFDASTFALTREWFNKVTNNFNGKYAEFMKSSYANKPIFDIGMFATVGGVDVNLGIVSLICRFSTVNSVSLDQTAVTL